MPYLDDQPTATGPGQRQWQYAEGPATIIIDRNDDPHDPSFRYTIRAHNTASGKHIATEFRRTKPGAIKCITRIVDEIKRSP